jgi:hypothetical protein
MRVKHVTAFTCLHLITAPVLLLLLLLLCFAATGMD